MFICLNGKERFFIQTRVGYETEVSVLSIYFRIVNTKYRAKFEKYIQKTFEERQEHIIKM